MEGHEYLSQLKIVEAPVGFQARILAELSVRKRRRIKIRRRNLALVGACASMAVILVVFGFNGWLQKPPDGVAASATDYSPGLYPEFPMGRSGGVIPITETMNYSGEIRNMRQRSKTVYILEYISDSTDTEYKF